MSAPTLRLRAATPDDLPFLLGLAPRLTASAPPWRDRAEMTAGYTALLHGALNQPEPGSVLLVAEPPDGEALGFTLLYWLPEERQVFVKDLAVSEAAQGQGVGQFLMTAILDWARARGAAEVMLKTSSFNERARAFYERAGFREEYVALVHRLE